MWGTVFPRQGAVHLDFCIFSFHLGRSPSIDSLAPTGEKVQHRLYLSEQLIILPTALEGHPSTSLGRILAWGPGSQTVGVGERGGFLPIDLGMLRPITRTHSPVHCQGLLFAG